PRLDERCVPILDLIKEPQASRLPVNDARWRISIRTANQKLQRSESRNLAQLHVPLPFLSTSPGRARRSTYSTSSPRLNCQRRRPIVWSTGSLRKAISRANRDDEG